MNPFKIHDEPYYKSSGGGHSLQEALNRVNLTDEEMYFILRFADRLGYDRAIKRLTPGHPWQTIREWFVSIGWEKPELMQWDGGCPRWVIFSRDCYTGKVRFHDPFPLSFFGHRITFQSFGVTIRLRRRSYLCFTSDFHAGFPNKLYWSPNGTPCHERTRMFWRRKWKTRREKEWAKAD